MSTNHITDYESYFGELKEIRLEKQGKGFPGGWIIRAIYKNKKGEETSTVSCRESTLNKALSYIGIYFKND